jgi:hypothetical protein
MKCVGLDNPLAVAQLVSRLAGELENHGLAIAIDDNFRTMDSVKSKCRSSAISPMFDAAVNDFSGSRAFWMSLCNDKGEIVALQAFRCDTVETSLADWCVPYMIGLYMRRQELLVPTHASAPKGSIAERLSGRLVYHGELWIDRQLRPRTITDTFSRLGLLLSLLKWHPDAIWALTSHSMATHGYSGKLGYPYLEPGFLRWEWVSDGIEANEYLGVIDRQALCQYVDEQSVTAPEYQPVLLHT